MQRQLRLGDILDDYCPRERRVTNHAVVAMVGEDVKQTRCSTCDAEHEYKHAKVPRQRRKPATPAALYAQVAAGGPKRHEPAEAPGDRDEREAVVTDPEDLLSATSATSNGGSPHAEATSAAGEEREALAPETQDEDARDDDDERAGEDEGPVHRPLIRASLPRQEGQAPPARALPDFTIRQPGGRPNRFRPRHQRGGFGGQNFQGNRNGNVAGNQRGGGMPRHGGGGSRPPMMKRHGGGGRKRSK
jgi:hypothetical protein